jgi:hypothetical protein
MVPYALIHSVNKFHYDIYCTQSVNHKPYTNSSFNKHPYPILANVIPPNMLLVLQLLVVLITNNGNCHITKKVMTIITLTIFNTYATFPLSQTPTRFKITCCIMVLWWQQDYGIQYFLKCEHYQCTRFNLHRPRLEIHAKVQQFHVHCHIHNWFCHSLILDGTCNNVLLLEHCQLHHEDGALVDWLDYIHRICAFNNVPWHGIKISFFYGDSINGRSLLMRSSNKISNNI